MADPKDGYYLEPGYVPDVPDPTGRWHEPGLAEIVQKEVSGGLLPPVNLTPPSISGVAQVGQILTRVNGTWANSPTSFSHQWYAGGVAISGQTGATYTSVTADIGKAITVSTIATNAAGSSAMVTSAATSAVIAAAAVAKALIVDTDMIGDIDDAAAMAVLARHVKAGLANVLGYVSSSGGTSNLGTYSTPCTNVLANKLGIPAPAYSFQDTVGFGGGALSYNDGGFGIAIRNRFATGNTSTTKTGTAVALSGANRGSYILDTVGYRTMLAAAPDASVTVCLIGAPTAFARFLATPADGIDARTGQALAAAKVKEIIIMGGNFQAATAEYNASRDVAATQAVAAITGIPIYWNDFNNGTGVLCGPPGFTDPTADPVKYGFDIYWTNTASGLSNSKRVSYDPLAVDFAIRGNQSRYNISAGGTVAVDSTGITTFTAGGAANHFIVAKTGTGAGTNAALGTELDGYIASQTVAIPNTVKGFYFPLTETTGQFVVDPDYAGAEGVLGGNPGNTTNDPARVTINTSFQAFGFTAASSQFIEIEANETMGGSSWACCAAFAPDALTGVMSVVSHSDLGAAFGMLQLNAGRLRAFAYTDATGAGATSVNIEQAVDQAVGTYVMATAYCDGSTLRLRVNGAEVGTVAVTTPFAGSAKRSQIGSNRSGTGSNQNFLSGKVASAGVKAVASLADVQALETKVRNAAVAKGITLP